MTSVEDSVGSVVETLLDAVEEEVDSLSSTDPTADRTLRYRAHSALRAAHGLDYRDRGPVRHSREDLIRADLDRLVGVDPSPGLPGRLSADPLTVEEVEDLRAWREETVEMVEEDLGLGAARASALSALLGRERESTDLCPLCDAPVRESAHGSLRCLRGHVLGERVEPVEGGVL